MNNQEGVESFTGKIGGLSLDIVFSGNVISQEFIGLLAGAIEKVKEELSFIDATEVGIVKIELINSRASYDERLGENTQNWESGRISDGTLVIFDINAIEEHTSHLKSEYAEIMVHEISHMFMRSVNQKMLDWVNEGIAQYVANQVVYRNPSEEDLSYFFSHDFQELTDYNVFINKNGYAISLLIIQFIVVERKEAILRDLINLDGRGNCLHELETLLGRSLRDIEQDLRSFIDTNTLSR